MCEACGHAHAGMFCVNNDGMSCDYEAFWLGLPNFFFLIGGSIYVFWIAIVTTVVFFATYKATATNPY